MERTKYVAMRNEEAKEEEEKEEDMEEDETNKSNNKKKDEDGDQGMKNVTPPAILRLSGES